MLLQYSDEELHDIIDVATDMFASHRIASHISFSLGLLRLSAFLLPAFGIMFCLVLYYVSFHFISIQFRAPNGLPSDRIRNYKEVCACVLLCLCVLNQSSSYFHLAFMLRVLAYAWR